MIAFGVHTMNGFDQTPFQIFLEFGFNGLVSEKKKTSFISSLLYKLRKYMA